MSALLLQLHQDAVLEVIELLDVDYRLIRVDAILGVKDFSLFFPEQVEEWRGHPLKALRLTCRYLANLCTPTLFRGLDVMRLMWLRGEEQEPLFTFLSKSGHVVKNISLDMMLDSQSLDGWNPAEAEDFNARVLGHCNTVRRLTIFHKRDNKSKLQLLFDNIRNLSSLEEIHIIGLGQMSFRGDIRVGDASNHVAHRLLDVVLDEHASRLRTIKFVGVIPLTIATFEKIKHSTPKLNRLEIAHGLVVHHRESLATPTAWACAANLQHLRLIRCRGVHAAVFTRQLAAGAIGHLRTLYMSVCGTGTDDETLPVATKWTIPALEDLDLDHFAAWEMRHLGMIHARKVFLSRVFQVDYIEDNQGLITAMKDTTTFPGAIELHVTPEWEDQDFNDLRIACFTRDIKVVERDCDSVA